MGEMALVQSEDFTEACGRFTALPTETFFAYCNFEDFEIEGRSVEGAMIGCMLTRIDWYAGFFCTALLSHCIFEDCIFRGCSFRSVDMISCAFRRCRFLLDNMQSACVFDKCRFLDCAFENCEFVPPVRGEPLLAQAQFYACRESGTRGIARLI